MSQRAPRDLVAPTRDRLKQLANKRGENNADAVRLTIEKILATPVDPDGLDFDVAKLVIEPLHEGQDDEGVRASLAVGLGNIRIPLQIEIALGQAVEPEAEEDEYQGLLEGPSARVWTYPREVVVAEKFQALVRLGVTNNSLARIELLAQL